MKTSDFMKGVYLFERFDVDFNPMTTTREVDKIIKTTEDPRFAGDKAFSKPVMKYNKKIKERDRFDVIFDKVIEAHPNVLTKGRADHGGDDRRVTMRVKSERDVQKVIDVIKKYLTPAGKSQMRVIDLRSRQDDPNVTDKFNIK